LKEDADVEAAWARRELAFPRIEDGEVEAPWSRRRSVTGVCRYECDAASGDGDSMYPGDNTAVIAMSFSDSTPLAPGQDAEEVPPAIDPAQRPPLTPSSASLLSLSMPPPPPPSLPLMSSSLRPPSMPLPAPL